MEKTKMHAWKTFALIGALALGACGGNDAEAEAEAEQAANELAEALGGALDQAAEEAAEEAAGGAAEAAGGDVALPDLDLQIAVPAGSRVGAAIGAEGHMITGPGLALTVSPATDGSPETLDAAKEDAEMYSPTNVQEETLEDGWVLTYENTGGMGSNYFVTVRRTIGETTIMCSTTASSAEQQAAAVEACKSIHCSSP